MTAITPASSSQFTGSTNVASSSSTSASDPFGKDMFLKLLIAQLKNQNPLEPTDPSSFLTQTAQFSMVEKLDSIDQQSKQATAAYEVLEATGMIGRRVNAALSGTSAGAPIASTQFSLGGNLPSNSPIGAKFSSSVSVYTSDGAVKPLKVELTKVAADSDGSDWDLRTFVGDSPVSGPDRVHFDAQGARTTGDVTISATQLARIAGTAGKWGAGGITINLGSATDSGRLHVSAGSSTIAALDADGSDGTTLSGVVTGVRFDLNGPMLRVGDREIPLTSVIDVHLAS